MNIVKRREIFLIIVIAILIALFVILAIKLGKIGYRTGDIKEINGKSINMDSIISIEQGDLNIGKNQSLGLFKNEKGKKIVFPGASGVSKFCIQNTTDDDIKYDIKFSDINKRKVNIKYRLKMDNIYIKGNESKFEDISNLDINEIRVMRNSNNVFALEWKWIEENDKKDTEAASIDEEAFYTLNLQVIATRIGK